jgi:hypothetical protein
MSRRYAIVDVANLFYRARHAAQGDAFTKAGLALTIIFRSLRKLHREFKTDHFVFTCEGRSWRYDIYPKYKSKRKLDKMEATPAEKEEEAAFMHVMNDFQEFLNDKTRCTVLQKDGVEGDDWIAHWIALHPDDEHIILSSDSDFVQLLSPKVKIYNGLDDTLLTTDGVFRVETGEQLVFAIKPDSGKVSIKGTFAEARTKHELAEDERQIKHREKQVKKRERHDAAEAKKQVKKPSYEPVAYVPEPFVREEFSFTIEPEWWRKALFVKLIRGDVGDSVFSSYPGVFYKGSSKRAGICEAWEDRKTKDYVWNNFFQTEWDKIVGFDPQTGDPIKEKVTVGSEFKINESLIDLTQMPDRIKNLMTEVVFEAVQKPKVQGVGVHFLKFCKDNYLPSLIVEAQDHAAYLNAPYA